MKSKVGQTFAPQGIDLHLKIKVDHGSLGKTRVDLIPADSIVLFLKIAKKTGSNAADELIDALAGLSIQQLFADAFGISMTAQSRQAYLKDWHSVRGLAKMSHLGMCKAAIAKGHPGHLVHDYMTTLIFGETAKAARMKTLVDDTCDPDIGLNYQGDIAGMEILAKVKYKYGWLQSGDWRSQVERAVAEVIG